MLLALDGDGEQLGASGWSPATSRRRKACHHADQIESPSARDAKERLAEDREAAQRSGSQVADIGPGRSSLRDLFLGGALDGRRVRAVGKG